MCSSCCHDYYFCNFCLPGLFKLSSLRIQTQCSVYEPWFSDILGPVSKSQLPTRTGQHLTSLAIYNDGRNVHYHSNAAGVGFSHTRQQQDVFRPNNFWQWVWFMPAHNLLPLVGVTQRVGWLPPCRGVYFGESLWCSPDWRNSWTTMSLSKARTLYFSVTLPLPDWVMMDLLLYLAVQTKVLLDQTDLLTLLDSREPLLLRWKEFPAFSCWVNRSFFFFLHGIP